jgi:hypothetical protein
MKYHPLLCTDEVIRRLLDGRQTQDRRPMRTQPEFSADGMAESTRRTYMNEYAIRTMPWWWSTSIPVPGDRFYCREAWRYRGSSWTVGDKYGARRAEYLADGTVREFQLPHPCDLPPHQVKPKDFARRYLAKYPEACDGRDEMAWDDFLCDWWKRERPAMHMPRWACRLELDILEVRAERLQEIDEAGAIAEGVTAGERCCNSARCAFGALWDSIYGAGPYSWTANPWVRVCTVRRITT